jgi:hypothetical protein
MAQQRRRMDDVSYPLTSGVNIGKCRRLHIGDQWAKAVISLNDSRPSWRAVAPIRPAF